MAFKLKNGSGKQDKRTCKGGSRTVAQKNGSKKR